MQFMHEIDSNEVLAAMYTVRVSSLSAEDVCLRRKACVAIRRPFPNTMRVRQ
jgi:hypothetical protein